MYEVRKQDQKLKENFVMECLYSFGIDDTNFFVIYLV